MEDEFFGYKKGPPTATYHLRNTPYTLSSVNLSYKYRSEDRSCSLGVS